MPGLVLAAWASWAHLPTIPCLRRGASAGGALRASGGNAAARGQLVYSMPSIGDAYRQAPQQSWPGHCVLPSLLLLVSGPEPAWIMPLAGTFMRRRHVSRPESMAPPRIARPQPGGEARRICTAYRRIARRRVPSASSLRRDRQRPHRPHRLRPATRVGAPARNRQVVSARRHSPMPPCAACPGPGIEKLSIRFDDPGRLHRSGFRGPGASGNPSKCQEDRGNRRALAIRREVTDGNRPG